MDYAIVHKRIPRDDVLAFYTSHAHDINWQRTSAKQTHKHLRWWYSLCLFRGLVASPRGTSCDHNMQHCIREYSHPTIINKIQKQ